MRAFKIIRFIFTESCFLCCDSDGSCLRNLRQDYTTKEVNLEVIFVFSMENKCLAMYQLI